MVAHLTIHTLAQLEAEMAEAGRLKETTALRDALLALEHEPAAFMIAAEAGRALGVEETTIVDWTTRGTLVGGQIGNIWVVSKDSVESVLDLRRALRDIADEGIPSEAEIRSAYDRSPHTFRAG